MSAWGFAKGLGKGVVEGLRAVVVEPAKMAVDGWKQLGQMVVDPQMREDVWEGAKIAAKEAKEAAGWAAENPREAIEGAKNGALTVKNKVKEYAKDEWQAYQDAKAQGHGAEFAGQAIGRVGTEIASLFVPIGLASKAGKAGKAQRALAATDATVLPCGKSAIPLSSKKMIEKARAAKLSNVKIDVLPNQYLSPEYIADHLSHFDDGVVKIIGSKPRPGVFAPGEDVFVMPKKELNNLITKAKGDPRELEKMLGLNSGTLKDPYVVEFTRASEAVMATGNELRANEHWLPGGYTSKGVREAVIKGDIDPSDFVSYPAFGGPN